MLVHSQVTKYDWQDERTLGPAKAQIASAVSYFVKDNKVSMISSVKSTGLNRHSNNRWYRWENTSGKVVWNRNGRVSGFSMSYPRSFWGGVPFSAIEGDERFASLVAEHIGPVTFEGVYPLAGHYGITENRQIPQGMGTALKQADLRSLLDVAFGKTRYRRDLMRTAGRANSNAIAFARDFRGLVPIDWIVDFLLRNPRNDEINYNGIKSIRPILLRADPRSYRDLLRNTAIDTGTTISVNDSMRYGTDWERIQPGLRIRTVDDIHQAVFGRPRRNNGRVGAGYTYVPPPPPVNKPVVLNDLAKAFDNQPVGEYIVKMPVDTDQIRGWGTYMHNCIGSYAEYMTKGGDRVLGGVYKGDLLMANFEVDQNNLRQLLGKYNNPLDAELRGSLEKFFIDHKVTVSNYWGQQERERFGVLGLEW